MTDKLTYLQAKILELNKKGLSQRQIALELNTPLPHVNESLKAIAKKGYVTQNTKALSIADKTLSINDKVINTKKEIAKPSGLYWARYCAKCGRDQQLDYGDTCMKCGTLRKRV